ncbi:MAG: glycoside hydrolase family 2 protein, partial [Candidatus Saccharimonadales bacterium]
MPGFVSGGANYQGIVWYRKHFRIPAAIRNKRITLTFEAIMGKSAIYLNGHLLGKHKGGYLPIVLDLSSSGYLNLDGENVVTVMADNSNDPTYPPGKPEYGLDFTYDGGIYRDAWLLATNQIYITNAIAANKVAGGGIRVGYTHVSEAMATVHVHIDLFNESAKNASLIVRLMLKDNEGKTVASCQEGIKLQKGREGEVLQSFNVSNPSLWAPDHPYLYDLYAEVLDKQRHVIDGYYIRTGIKTVELRGREGLYLNGKPFRGKLMGVNHHQAFGYIGNAVPDNLLWQDAKLMRDAGIKIIRLSHYPQSPEFMDACDELGIFTIVCSSGWQFWNRKDTAFEKLMERDIRQMIRRDRNHASVFAWEPLPNETHYPGGFGKIAYEITHAE